MTDDGVAGPESTGAEIMAAMLDLSSPQASYKAVIDGPGFIQPAEGMVLTFDRALTEHVLRHHELFSSRVEMNLGNVRPLIPLNVDPPLHSKYRKLLDPLFAPKRMDEQEADITRRVVALMTDSSMPGNATSRRILPRSSRARCSSD
jgi:cytochrome P450